MTKIISMLFWLLLPSICLASDFEISFSSAVGSGVIVTTGTAIRVDNWINGSQNGTSTIKHAGVGIFVSLDRTNILVQNQDSADDIYCDFASGVSTTTVSAGQRGRIGRIIDQANVETNIGCDFSCQYWCLAVDAAGAAGVLIRLEQIAGKQ